MIRPTTEARTRAGIAATALLTIVGGLQGPRAQQPSPTVPPAPAVAQQAPTDDRYRFVGSGSEEHAATAVRIPEGVQLKWVRPAAASWHTALVGVRIAGAEHDSYVEMIAGGRRIRQHIDPFAVGLRWLNVTGLRGALAPDVPLDLHGHGVTLESGPATARFFTQPVDLSGRILILAPHPDDAEIAAFGVYAGRNATIVTVTSGNAGDFNYRAQVSDPAQHYLLKGYLRAVDSVTVPWLGGIPPERTYNMGYFDARLETMRSTPNQPVAEMYGPNQDVSVYRRANIGRLLPNEPRMSTWNNLVEDLVEVFRRVRPQVVVMPHPWLDTHKDHQYTAVAAVEALEKWNERPTFLLYTNHAAENLYPFGPTGTVMSIPPWPAFELPADGVYSHPVDERLQLRKLFALESMHDLRLSPEEQNTCGVPGLPRRPDYPRNPVYDYLRRGVRSEEVFFLYGRDSVREVIRTFLAQPKPAN